MNRPHVAIIGAGPAGLMAAEVIASGGADVTIYERMPSVGRKFLLAGRGGLNLTHSESLDTFMTRYREATPHLRAAVEAFPPDALRAWSEDLGQPTFVGSSGRVFPKSFKASPLLRAWLQRLDGQGVRLALRHRWTGWNADGDVQFEQNGKIVEVKADATVLALGGGSWPRLGSDGSWSDILKSKDIAIAPLASANCGFHVAWSDIFRARFEGQPLKDAAFSFGDETIRGEATITKDGIEGGAIYALSAPLRDAVLKDGHAVLHIALRPGLDAKQLVSKLAVPREKQSLSNFLRKAISLSPVAMGLLHEAAIASKQNLAAINANDLASLINAVHVQLNGVASITRAISTAGGIPFSEIDKNYMLRKIPGVFAAGEMLDWEAPTGGYLLQASFATGAAAGRGVLNYLKS